MSDQDKAAGSNGTVERKDMIQACGLWTGKDRNGNTFLSGSLGGLRIMIFRNTFKSEEKQPDYRLYLSEREHEARPTVDDDPLAGHEEAAPAQAPAQPSGEAPAQPAKGKEDDIPF